MPAKRVLADQQSRTATSSLSNAVRHCGAHSGRGGRSPASPPSSICRWQKATPCGWRISPEPSSAAPACWRASWRAPRIGACRTQPSLAYRT